MDDQNKNLIIATALSFVVILVWFVLFPPPEPETPIDGTIASQSAPVEGSLATPSADVSSAAPAATASTETAPSALESAPRVAIETQRLSGSLSLLGGRIDQLSLNDYQTSLEDDATVVEILFPANEDNAQYALHGWAAASGVDPSSVPGPNTEWQLSEGETLSVETPVTLSWDNGAGLVFSKKIAVDDEYMFTITQSVENTGETAASMAPYAVLARHGEPTDLKNFFILHEGVVAMTDGEYSEINWDEMPDFEYNQRAGARTLEENITENGWIGFTDHYWMSVLIPTQGTAFKSVAKYDERRDIYQTEAVSPVQTVATGQTISNTTQFFVGAKEWEVLKTYEDAGVYNFIDSIDWGWFSFLTKPIFWLLHQLNLLIGNMGISIIALTLLIKALLFPLAYKSYVSMAKMKELQPKMEKLKEEAGDDRQKVQQGMMELYKKEKVNPAAGCLPILLQIPIFFSLYKVIFVTIELRHAPFFGPFQDLSAPDPTTIFNLYGLLPWGAPEVGSIMALVFIGILPLLLGISMWLQQKLNPAPTDPTQKMIFAWMPWVFMFMLGSFASGLVVYWIANNTITFTQQYLIMRSQGYKPDLLGNIKSSFSRQAKAEPKK
ncbi:membrane protein insertase YidC [Sulfitobacter donghicola]|uniref:Membrane protein insertase YidC n=1 Tax=Sulfitobacter donghicola DSW-25 = KCTC 12864 = JCM 14565 TaxID=1300350 RepID=A0A073ITD3_9RHOB|nr:membrane protein insertase YidC [Sulfitobacter donghicola]KEJ88667.1 insertase [Sulfitobacter donghicola DSW-25 = KCTC 12864 = JCM 14565]KIN68435.1 Membrane protein insertase YidC [Sulfitobacter donghicola DSW-25 = KCTC 12864 = JCM 14565]